VKKKEDGYQEMKNVEVDLIDEKRRKETASSFLVL